MSGARISIALWILTVVAVLFFLREAQQLLIPIALAFLVSYALEPIVKWLAKHGVPRTVGSTVVMASTVGLALWGVIGLRTDALNLVQALPQFMQRVREWIVTGGGGASGSGVKDAAKVLAPAASSAGQGMMGLVQQGAGAVLTFTGNLVVVCFLTYFLLLAGPHFRNRLVEIAAAEGEQQTTASIIDDIDRQLQRFLLVRGVTAAIVGVLTWLVLAWLGVQNAAVWGLLAGVFNSIPYFGPVIVSGGLLVIGMAQGGGWTHALEMSGAALAITSLEGWLITPTLLGKAERMSVLAVFLGLLLWTWLWGAWGTLLAVPMLAVVQSVATHVRVLRPLARLMAP